MTVECRTFFWFVFIEFTVWLAVALPEEWNALHRLFAEELSAGAVGNASFGVACEVKIVGTGALEVWR